MNQKMPTALKKANAPKASTASKPPCPHEHYVMHLVVRFDGDTPVEHYETNKCDDCNAMIPSPKNPLSAFFEAIR